MAQTISEVLAWFKKAYGITLNEAQAQEYLAFQESKNKAFTPPERTDNAELSDEDLEAVAGGTNPDDGSKDVVEIRLPWCPVSENAAHTWEIMPSDPTFKQCVHCHVVIGVDWEIIYY